MMIGRWNAAEFFEKLTNNNLLAQKEGFFFGQCSGLDGFEDALKEAQEHNAFVCVSDISDGSMDMNNTPRTRQVKTVFLAMRHEPEDMKQRQECMEIMRELFRQFCSVLIQERVRLEQNCLYMDPRISFNEIERYFFTGCACAYFHIAVDCFTDLQFRKNEWSYKFSL